MCLKILTTFVDSRQINLAKNLDLFLMQSSAVLKSVTPATGLVGLEVTERTGVAHPYNLQGLRPCVLVADRELLAPQERYMVRRGNAPSAGRNTTPSPVGA